LFLKHALAVDYFDFLPSAKLLDYDGTVFVKIFYDLKDYREKDFLVRPISDNGLIFIYDDLRNTWQAGNALWSELPYLQREMRLKLKGYRFLGVHLQILNLLTGETYQTPSYKFWFRDNYRNYTKTVNNNIFNYQILEK
jgi:hypothetical protein